MKPKRLKLSPQNTMASSSSSLSSTFVEPPLMRDEETINWLELPPELMASILLRLDAVEILESAQKVCKYLYRASKDPLLWRKIDIQKLEIHGERYDFVSICRQAVDRSQGGLVEINLSYFGSDSLLAYIADRSSNLRRLALELPNRATTNQGLVNALAKFSSLEELVIIQPMRILNLKDIGHSCPKLKTFKIMFLSSKPSYILADNLYANEIAASMPQLRHLQLIADGLTNTGLEAILENCSQLEHLDLRFCINVNLVGDLKKRSSQRIKVLRLPHDSAADCPLIATYEERERKIIEYLEQERL